MLNSLYDRASIFCMPSSGEGFGLVYLEAMQRGCVCVVSDRDAAREVVGDTGFIVGLENEDELADAIRRLTSDADLLEAKLLHA